MARKKQPRVGLGDWVASGIVFFTLGQGLRLAQWAAGLFGKDCGCKKRQDALNRAGRRLTGNEEEASIPGVGD